jgi:hypothetical protein
MCGSSPGMVGVGRSTCAGGGARQRRVIRPGDVEARWSKWLAREARPGDVEAVCGRNLRMAQRLTRSTFVCERKKSGEGDSGSPVRLCRVQGLGELHGPLAKLTK